MTLDEKQRMTSFLSYCNSYCCFILAFCCDITPKSTLKFALFMYTGLCIDVLLSINHFAFVFNSCKVTHEQSYLCDTISYVVSLSAAVRSQSILSPLYRQTGRGEEIPDHSESCHCNVDRLLLNIDEAKQKHKAFHTWLVELLKIEGPVSIWRNDILVLTPQGTWGHSTNSTNTRTWEHCLRVQFTGSRS